MDEYEEILYLVRLIFVLVTAAALAVIFALTTPSFSGEQPLRADIFAATIANEPYSTEEGIRLDAMRATNPQEALVYDQDTILALAGKITVADQELIYNQPGYTQLDATRSFSGEQRTWTSPVAVDGERGSVTIEVLYEE